MSLVSPPRLWSLIVAFTLIYTEGDHARFQMEPKRIIFMKGYICTAWFHDSNSTPKASTKDTKNFLTFNPSAVNSVNVKVTKISTISWTKGSGLCYGIPTPKCFSMPTWVKLGCWLKGGGQSSRVIKGSLLDSKWKWGCFLPWGSLIFPGVGSQKKKTLHAEKLI